MQDTDNPAVATLENQITERYGLLFKAAFFSGDAPGFPDTTKFWLQLTAAY